MTELLWYDLTNLLVRWTEDTWRLRDLQSTQNRQVGQKGFTQCAGCPKQSRVRTQVRLARPGGAANVKRENRRRAEANFGGPPEASLRSDGGGGFLSHQAEAEASFLFVRCSASAPPQRGAPAQAAPRGSPRRQAEQKLPPGQDLTPGRAAFGRAARACPGCGRVPRSHASTWKGAAAGGGPETGRLRTEDTRCTAWGCGLGTTLFR